MLFEPIILAGTVLGVILNLVMPKISLLVMLIITLAYNFYLTLIKGISLYKSEVKASEAEVYQIDEPLRSEALNKPSN